ncbi:hypothetical protein C8R44DRAFT_987325 [Mycena epipterygia]|nr:hypothetical protein C8R44DRAFT_987325 [Mycena epipterygia]
MRTRILREAMGCRRSACHRTHRPLPGNPRSPASDDFGLMRAQRTNSAGRRVLGSHRACAPRSSARASLRRYPLRLLRPRIERTPPAVVCLVQVFHGSRDVLRLLLPQTATTRRAESDGNDLDAEGCMSWVILNPQCYSFAILPSLHSSCPSLFVPRSSSPFSGGPTNPHLDAAWTSVPPSGSGMNILLASTYSHSPSGIQSHTPRDPATHPVSLELVLPEGRRARSLLGSQAQELLSLLHTPRAAHIAGLPLLYFHSFCRFLLLFSCLPMPLLHACPFIPYCS